MTPDWKLIPRSDPLYNANVPKWAANAHGVDDLRDLPDIGPDFHSASNGYWVIERIQNANMIGSRFIATRPLVAAPKVELPAPAPEQHQAGKLGT